MLRWEDIDQHDPQLSDAEQFALRKMMEKAGEYIARGEETKAHGCMVATLIFYVTCKGMATDPNTGHMPL